MSEPHPEQHPAVPVAASDEAVPRHHGKRRRHPRRHRVSHAAAEGQGAARLANVPWLPILLLCALVYANSLHNGFHYDDEHSIVRNPHLRDLANVPAFFIDPTCFSVDADKAMYRPLLLVSYALNYAAGGYGVFGYHLLNLGLHAACACLVWRLAGALGLAPLAAALAGLLFAAHPLATEPVNYISSRSESLAASFYLLGLLAFLRRLGTGQAVTPAAAGPEPGPDEDVPHRAEAREDGEHAGDADAAQSAPAEPPHHIADAPGRMRALSDRLHASMGACSGWTVVSCGALALGLLSKDTAVTLPAVVLLADLLRRSQGEQPVSLRALARRHAPYWATAALYLLVIWANGFLPGSVDKLARPLGQQLLTQAKALVYYAALVAWPVPLSVEHQFAVAQGPGAAVLAALAVLASGAFLLARALRRGGSGLPLFLLGWALLSLLPVLVMPLNVLVNERRLYLPTAAWCIGLAGALVTLPGALRIRRGAPAGTVEPGLPVAVAAVGLLIIGYGVVAWERNGVWQDDLQLWQSAAERAPLMPRVHLYLGNAHKDAAQVSPNADAASAAWEEAARQYEQALRLDPQGELGLRARGNLGSVYFSAALADGDPAAWARDLDAAERAYRYALSVSPQYADGLVNMGSLCYERARRSTDPAHRGELLQQAVDWYVRALQIEPNHAAAWANLGLAYFGLGDLGRAQQAYRRSYSLSPRDPDLLSNMGNLLLAAAQRQTGEARRRLLVDARDLYEQSLRLSPGYTAAGIGLHQAQALLQGAP